MNEWDEYRMAEFRERAERAEAERDDLRHNLALRAFTAPDADDAVMLASLDTRINDAHVTIRALVQDDDKAVIARVREMHRPYRSGFTDEYDVCEHCSRMTTPMPVPWPCPTRRIVDGVDV